jgi:glucoamylase
VQLKDKILSWTTGRKDGIGTALSDTSHVYFTIGNGRLTETYFPSPDSIAIHSVTLFLNSTISETDFDYSVEIPNLSVPFYKIASSEVKKEIITNPYNDTLLLRYRVNYQKNTLKIAFPQIGQAKKMYDKTVSLKVGKSYLLIHLNVPFSFEHFKNFILLHTNTHFFTLIISFGNTIGKAEKSLFETENMSFYAIKKDFFNGWIDYVKKLNIRNKSNLYKRSIITIKSMEDKIYKGAAVASIAIPWGSKSSLSEQNGYHLVWVRDLFFSAFAMLSAGDRKFANSALNYMLEKLKRPDGSFKQNATIKGEERWNATQMDQVAFPIILAHLLKRNDLNRELRKSADYIVKHGPWSEQERWEEIGGFSPYAISLQVLALLLYASMQEKKGLSSGIYKEKAYEFGRLIPQYCYTKDGIFPPGEYFVRVSAGDPNKNIMHLKGKSFFPFEMISTDFLYLVFTGLYKPDHSFIKNSIEAVDNVLRVETPNGPSFYRYNGDIYGFDKKQPEGRLWVILTAERGIYELMRGRDVKNYLYAIEHFATPSYLLPEQVFEGGKPTESATPLAWSHAAYILLYDFLNGHTTIPKL